MKFFLSIFILICSLAGHAFTQDLYKMYFDEYWMNCDSTDHAYYRLFQYDSSSYIFEVNDYFKNGKIKSSGSYYCFLNYFRAFLNYFRLANAFNLI